MTTVKATRVVPVKIMTVLQYSVGGWVCVSVVETATIKMLYYFLVLVYYGMILIFSGSTAVACNTINITALLYRTRSSSVSGVVRQKCPRVCLYDRVRRLTAPEDTGPRASVDVTPSSRTPPVSLSQPSVWVCARVCARVCERSAMSPN